MKTGWYIVNKNRDYKLYDQSCDSKIFILYINSNVIEINFWI